MGQFNDFSDKAVTGGKGGMGGGKGWEGRGGLRDRSGGQKGTMWEEVVGGQEEKMAVAGGTKE